MHTVCAPCLPTPRRIRATPENRAVFRATVKRDTIVTLRSSFHLKQALLRCEKNEGENRVEFLLVSVAFKFWSCDDGRQQDP